LKLGEVIEALLEAQTKKEWALVGEAIQSLNDLQDESIAALSSC
jgi:hypothetical protein